MNEDDVLVALYEDGPLSHEEITKRLFGCECSRKITRSEVDEVSEAVRELHRRGEVKYTLDRRVAVA